MSIATVFMQAQDRNKRMVAEALDAGARARVTAERRALSWAIQEMFDQRLEGFVATNMQARADPDTWVAMKCATGIKSHNNVMRDAVVEAAVAWAFGSQLSLTKNGVEVKDDRFNTIMHEGDYNGVMARCDRWMLLHPAVAIMPTVVFDEHSGKRRFKHLVLHPGQFDLTPSRHDGTTDEEFTHFHPVVTPAGDVVEGKTVWSALEWCRYALGAQNEWKLLDQGVNRYRRIPRVLVRLDDSALWSPCYGPMLYDVTVEVNVAETQHSYMMGSQVKTLVGQAPEFPPGQFLRQAGVVVTGNAEGMMIADMQTNLAAFVAEYITRPREVVYSAMGLAIPEKDTSTTPPSGYAMRMRNRARDERADKRREILRKAAAELFWLDMEFLWHQLGTPSDVDGARVVLPIKGFEAADGSPGTPDKVLSEFVPGLHWERQPCQFSAVVNGPSYPDDPEKEQARDAADVASGQTNRAEVYMRRHPEVRDAKAAVQAVMDNIKMEAAFAAASAFKVPRPPPGVAGAAEKPAQAPPAEDEKEDAPEAGEGKDTAAADGDTGAED